MLVEVNEVSGFDGRGQNLPDGGVLGRLLPMIRARFTATTRQRVPSLPAEHSERVAIDRYLLTHWRGGTPLAGTL
jgi:hypothetical protein